MTASARFIDFPASLISTYNIIIEAMQERWNYFGFNDGVNNFDLPTLSAGDEFPRGRHFEGMVQKFAYLMANSLDARQIGGWVDFEPFAGINTYGYDDFKEFIKNFGYSPADFFFYQNTPYPWRKTSVFFEICQRLLNEIILFPTLHMIHLGFDEELVNFRSGYIVGIKNKWRDYNAVGTYPNPQNVYNNLALLPRFFGARYESQMSADYDPDDEEDNYDYWFKAYTEKSWIENHSRLQFSGDWFMRYTPIESDSKGGETDFYIPGEKRLLTIHGNKSELLPKSDLIQRCVNEYEALPENAAKENFPYRSRLSQYECLFDECALLTWDNMPELPYKYYNKGE